MFTLQLTVYTVAISSVNKIVINEWLQLNNSGFLMRLVQTYWWDAIMMCWASGYYGTAFKASRGVTQGGPLSAKLFNILVDAVVWEWLHQLQVGGDYEEDELLEMMLTFFAIFYVRISHHGMRDFFSTRSMSLLKIPHHAHGRLFEGVACLSA
jgi:hypothetical protein